MKSFLALSALAGLLAGTSPVSAQSAAPTITPGGVVNAADYTPAVAPGMIIAVFGDSLASKVSSAAGTPLPTVLDGTSVEVDGQAIPLFFVSPKQINAQMPFGVSGLVQVRVHTAAGVSAARLTVAASAPRLFTKTMDGKGEPILVHNADWIPVSAASPARPGEYVILFLTGLGAVSPAIPAGQAGGDNGQYGPLNQLPARAVTVAFGGKQVAILFAGLAPGWVGLYQINFQVPADMLRGFFALVVSTKDGISQAGVLAAAEGAVDFIDFVRINPGEFMMGCSPGDSECSSAESPRHQVRITKSFEMGQYEVTQAEWEAVMGRNPSSFKGATLPVESVSWEDIQQFLTYLNRRNDGYRYRMPTEAEWEYAARAGSTDKYAGGVPNEVAWGPGNSSSKTHPVGEKKPNAWGLYDMLGNVYEWCQDWYGSYLGSAAMDPPGPPSGSSRVFRGGSWFFSTSDVRVSSRTGVTPGDGYKAYFLGFRCVRER
jgi:uncharacterized protein (TIGR03437 family)